MSKLVSAERVGAFRDCGRASCRWLAASLALASILALVVFVKMVPVAGAADASGYMNFARLLGDGAMTDVLRVPVGEGFDAMPRSLFQPLGFSYRPERGDLTPVYPIGLPLLLSLGAAHESELVVRFVYAAIAFLACLGLWYLGGEMGLRSPWRLYAVAVLATSPLFLWCSLILMSDALAACQAVWVVFLARKACASRYSAFFCGVLLGWAVLTRPSSVLLFVPVVLIVVCGRLGWPRVILLLSGGLPFLALFFWSNWMLYGDPLGSGYGDLWSLFAWSHGVETFFHYGRTLVYALFALVLPTALLGAFHVRDSRAWVFLAWALPVFGFYAFYFFTSQTWWFLRFVLVGVPAVVLLSTMCLEALSNRILAAKTEMQLVVALVILSIGSLFYWEGRLNIFGEQAFEQRYAIECAWAVKNLEPGTLVVSMQSSGALYYYTDFPVFRWDLADDDLQWVGLKHAAGESGTGVVAILHAFEEKRGDSILARYPERWELIGDIANRVRAYRLR